MCQPRSQGPLSFSLEKGGGRKREDPGNEVGHVGGDRKLKFKPLFNFPRDHLTHGTCSMLVLCTRALHDGAYASQTSSSASIRRIV